MKEYFNIISKCSLFVGIEKDELDKLLTCLSVTRRRFGKGEFIFLAGDAVSQIGIVISGNVHIIQEDFWGNGTILAGINPGELFGEAFSCAQTEKLPVSAKAVFETEALFIDYSKIVSTCPSACNYHSRLIKNMMTILANKNVMLTQKMEFLSRRSTREKLLAYLSSGAQKAGGNTFTIPFNRQQLADYLSVDRSAMSSELSKMRDDGILKFSKNNFELMQ